MSSDGIYYIDVIKKALSKKLSIINDVQNTSNNIYTACYAAELNTQHVIRIFFLIKI